MRTLKKSKMYRPKIRYTIAYSPLITSIESYVGLLSGREKVNDSGQRSPWRCRYPGSLSDINSVIPDTIHGFHTRRGSKFSKSDTLANSKNWTELLDRLFLEL